jgi:hypothetical protein
MAKALAYQRATQEVVTVDTINNNITALGAVVAAADISPVFPLRARNLLAVYRGDPYLTYRAGVNEVRVAVFSGGVWTDIPSATITTGSGTVAPIGLHVVQDYLVSITWRQNSAGVDGLFAQRSADGSTWDPLVSLGATIQPTVSEGCHSIAWRNAVFVGTGSGIAYYDPIADAMSAGFDTGDDTLLDGTTIPAGNFTFWNNDLYFVKPDIVPTIYSLDSSFDTTSPPASPMWANRLPTGIPGLGAVTVGPDTGQFLLFVNKLDELCMLYSAALGTKLIRTTGAAFPIFTDVTDVFLDSALKAEANLGFALFVDDRRRQNELQSFLIHFPSAGDTQLASWNSVDAFNVRSTFTGLTLSPPDDRYGALRTFTNLQPTTHVRAVTQPFPGRVSLDYTVRDSSSRPVDVFGEYSIDGDVWSPMTQGDGDSGSEQLASSPAGTDYTFFWDAFVDLDGDFDNMEMRIVSRISGV